MNRTRAMFAMAVSACLIVTACASSAGSSSATETTVAIAGSSSVTQTTEAMTSTSAAPDQSSEQLANAEEFIDAFYSFDPDALQATLESAPDSLLSVLSYQGWAEGGHYKVLERHGCQVVSADYVECPVTVEDDLLLNLGSDFKVTDQFNLRFEGPSIVSVTTESDDPELVRQAFVWVFARHPEFEEGPCLGWEADDLETPQECAVAVTTAFKEFAASDEFPGS